MAADRDDGDAGAPFGRRVFLALLGLGAAGVVWGAKAQDLMERALGPITAKDGSGLSSLLPVGRFRIYTVTGGFPTRSTDEYRLRIDGLVDRPLDLSYDDLLSIEPSHLTRDFQCVTGWRVRDVMWTGVRLSDLLDMAGVKSAATALHFTSFDGLYTESLTLDQARRDDMLVAYQMEGEPVSRDHGGPVRLYVAPMYGYKSLKWLDGIEVTSEVRTGYWEQAGYDTDAWIGDSNGRDDEPVG
ncbi:MAG: molybdopterin-dependent oxidoreductase [Acidimicrobiia bacterium]|nr:molybdopterin-dependent oxidoreductase [Acidimicrobiia bacterium]